MIERMKEHNRRENASKGFRGWLKNSLKEAKKESYVKMQIKKLKKKQKKEKLILEERKKIEAEICFKRWKLKKQRESKQERRITKYQELKEQERLYRLKDQKKRLNQGADVMLAYSLNKNIRQLENLKKRPKSARMAIRA
jgi:hypothetical protein